MTAATRNLILTIVGENENRALEASSKQLGADLKGYGYESHVLDMSKPSSNQELGDILRGGKVAFAYGFAGVGSRFSIGETNLWTATQTPFICLWYDHPAYNYLQHIIDSPYIGHVYHIRDHLDARRKHLPASSSLSVLAPVWYGIASPVDRRAFRERERSIFYVKTGVDPNKISHEWKQYAAPLQEALWALVEKAKLDRNIDLASATADILSRYGESCNKLGLFMGIVAEVDSYIRAWRSDRLARALLKHPAVIVGRGWDYLETESSKAVFLPPISFQEYIQRVPTYKIIANTNPLWRDGVHERAILGFHYGAVTLTDRTEKTDYAFGGMPNYVGFEWQDNLEEVIAATLKLSDSDDVDYFSTAQKLLNAREPDSSEYYVASDYFDWIKQFVADIRNRNQLSA